MDVSGRQLIHPATSSPVDGLHNQHDFDDVNLDDAEASAAPVAGHPDEVPPLGASILDFRRPFHRIVRG